VIDITAILLEFD